MTSLAASIEKMKASLTVAAEIAPTPWHRLNYIDAIASAPAQALGEEEIINIVALALCKADIRSTPTQIDKLDALIAVRELRDKGVLYVREGK